MRFLGNTSIQVPQLCLGLMSFGSPDWQKWVLGKRESEVALHAALDFGIRFFDTADLYSDGGSEELLGKVLKESGMRHNSVIATKVGYSTTSVPGVGYGKRRIEAALDASLRRLGTDYIDLYQLHAWDPYNPLDETLHVLTELKRSGKIREFGICNFTTGQLRDAEALSVGGIASLQAQYNLVYRGIEGTIIPFANAANIGVLAYSPLARGYLVGTPSSANSENAARLKFDKKGQGLYGDWDYSDVRARIQNLAGSKGVSASSICIAWLLTKPISSVICGISTREQLQAASASLALRFTAEEITYLEAGYVSRQVELLDVENRLVVDREGGGMIC